MNAPKRQFQLNVPGLLKVLAENLYSNRKVAIRELIQNAHDSITRRLLTESDPAYRPRITIQADARTNTLTIEDNGDGMDDNDIVQYLTTIGNSYTREVSGSLEFLHPDRAQTLIGQFGMGFLSAFLIAASVTLHTRKANTDGGWVWSCDGGEYYDMRPANVAHIGTRITIALKPEAEGFINAKELTAIIQRYSDFLPIPIYLNGTPQPVNLMRPPWEADPVQPAIASYIDRTFHHANPLHIFLLHDQIIDLGHDTLTVPMRGVMFIPPNSVVSVREYGDVSVYIRHMFITDQERDLLPPWARFFRGVIDSPILQPTASRESLHQEESFMAVRQALEAQLLAELRRLAQDEPLVWRQIVVSHTDLVLGWVTVDDEFFEQVADLLPLQTSRGDMLLKDYLAQTGNTFYYMTQQIGSLQDRLLGEGYEVPVIDASWFAVKPFLEKYASRLPVPPRLVQMNGDAKSLMQPVKDSRFDSIIAFFGKHNIVAKVAAYKPVGVPALMLYPRNADTLIEARRALDSDELSDPFAGLVSDYLEQHVEDDEQPNGVLYLNASCGLIRQLGEMSASPARDAVLTLILHIAKLFSGRTLTAQDASAAFSTVTQSIQELLHNE